MAFALSYNLGAIPRLQNRVGRLATLDHRALLGLVGVEVESQTRRRISDDKSGPDGSPWASWSPAYAETRHAGHSLLEGSGDLLASIDHQVEADSVAIGSNLIYAAHQQFGSARDSSQNLPARPFLGLSAENEADIEALVDNFIDGVLGL